MSLPTLDLLVGITFCLLGALLVPSQRTRSVGLLLLATGAAWLMGNALPAAIFLYRGPLIQLLVSYPRGLPRGRIAQCVVGLGYLDTLQPIGRSHWATIGLAVAVTATVLTVRQRASGADRRARSTSSVVCAVLMSILAVGATARLAWLQVDPALVVVYDLALIASAIVLAADAAWGRWNAAAITSLVIDLGRSQDLGRTNVGSIRDTLAAALSDPGLELGFPDPGSDGLIDEAGRPVVIAAQLVGRERTTLRSGDADIAVVVHQPGALADPVLRDSITALTGLALKNARLQAGVRARVADVDASRSRILAATDRERAAMAADLEAVTDRRLRNIDLLLGPADAALHDLLEESRRSLRDFSRGIHPASLTDGGLAVACAELAGLSPLPVTIDIPPDRLPVDIELTLYFACAEALTNVAKYAAASRVRVQLTGSDGAIRLEISDDGKGGARLDEVPDGGTGLRGIADRLSVIGGSLTIDSPAGRGTTVIAEVARRPW